MGTLPTSRIVPFRVQHMDLLDLRPHEQELFDLGAGKNIALLAEYGTGGTIMYEGRVLGVIGFIEIHTGVYEIWLLPSIWLPQYATIVSKLVRKTLQSMEKSHPWHRLQTSAPMDDLHDRWMTFLGFQCEGILRQFTATKVDYKQWSRIR